jgi:hypothetical protein
MQGRYNSLLHVPKVTREESLKLTPADAPDHGVALSHFRNVSGVHALCLCPGCGKRARWLYRPPIVKAWQRHTPRHLLPHAENWACARCHNLTFKSSQRAGTRAAMREARERDLKEFRRLFSGGDGVSFEDFQKCKHRSYNRKKSAKIKKLACVLENSLRRDKSRQRP